MPSPPAGGRPGRLRLTNRSMVLAVVLLGLTLALLGMFAASARVLGWLLVAAVAAGLLHPLVSGLARHIPRAAAIVVVALGTLGAIGLVVYGVVDDLQDQVRRLERQAPAAAREVEQSDRFGEAAREFELTERVEQFVDELPQRLQGGDTATALRSAATRFVAYLATAVLTLFLLVHGRRLVAGGLAQIHDERRRVQVAFTLVGAYERAWRYVALTTARATVAGMFTWAVCRLADVPGSTVLGIWVAVWSAVPLIGVVVGSIPVVLLAAAVDLDRPLALIMVFLAYQVAEVLLVQRRLERRSLHVGPVLTLVAGMLGLELYGVGGLLVSVMLVVFVAAVGRELAPRDSSELLSAADELLAGDEPLPAPSPATARR